MACRHAANRKMSELLTTLGKSFMNVIKGRGPIYDPWGIPLITYWQSEYELFTRSSVSQQCCNPVQYMLLKSQVVILQTAQS